MTPLVVLLYRTCGSSGDRRVYFAVPIHTMSVFWDLATAETERMSDCSFLRSLTEPGVRYELLASDSCVACCQCRIHYLGIDVAIFVVSAIRSLLSKSSTGLLYRRLLDVAKYFMHPALDCCCLCHRHCLCSRIFYVNRIPMLIYKEKGKYSFTAGRTLGRCHWAGILLMYKCITLCNSMTNREASSY